MRLASRATLVLLVALAVSCIHKAGIQVGNAIGRIHGTVVGGETPLPPGSRIGFLMLYLHNVSDQAIVLQSVSLSGSGLGTTVRPVQIQAAPELGGVHGIPGSAFDTDPPVWQGPDGACHSAVLRPIRGFVLPPGGEARIWVVLAMRGQGKYMIGSHTVFYSQAGAQYEQVMSLGYQGDVEESAPVPRPDRTERPCLAETSLLN